MASSQPIDTGTEERFAELRVRSETNAAVGQTANRTKEGGDDGYDRTDRPSDGESRKG